MDSGDLYHVKQQFVLGAYKSLAGAPLPSPSSEDYSSILQYHARALISLGEADKALSILPVEDASLSLKAVRALAGYTKGDENETHLEQLRDLCVEVEDAEESEQQIVKVLAATAFVQEGEIEEALETLGAGTPHENLEATALIVQIYLSINRVDLAKKEFERAKHWAEDDLLLQQIEATLGLVSGRDSYSNPQSFFAEQMLNPSLSSSHLLTSRGVTYLLRGELIEANSDFEEALKVDANAETLAAAVVAAGLTKGKQSESDALFE
ncbi:hypothetical protein SISSUDRAFT_986717 [Sistotremastrum suecicum HHB10207 ss-3]|uniref:Uncharacterized protein n=1 Tax=Sistotremastrum suecicum HHB10207 ss-3 TaxID=1314776 RepID=A0A166D2W6_9AGAM|nr:hypothetical protein SISSUDRAFT_986717 [Sistotremastrum suecicum HHB10207 ss-3]